MIVIRADGGPDIGYGHLVRTGALATEFLARGHHVTYATTTPDAVLDVCPAGVSVTTLSTREKSESFLSWLEPTLSAGDSVVIDSYLADTEYMTAVRSATELLTVVSDDTRFSFSSDILVNGNLYANSLEYEFVGDPPKKLFGPRYVLLRDAVRKRAKDEPPVCRPPERAVITMGGSDIRNYTPTAVRAFDGFDIEVDVVIGPGANNVQAVASATAEVESDTTIHHAPSDFLDLIARADVAVSGCGSTIYELFALGTPFVPVIQAENQRPIADALKRRGFSEALPMDTGVEMLRLHIASLLEDHSRRERLRSNGQQIVDGLGVQRVCDEILSQIE